MESEYRVTDDDDSRFVWEGFGPPGQGASPERRLIQRFMQRLVRDVLAHPDDYGPLRDPLVLLAENYARTCATVDELERRLDADVELAGDDGQDSTRPAAAVLLRRVWQAQRAVEQSAGSG